MNERMDIIRLSVGYRMEHRTRITKYNITDLRKNHVLPTIENKVKSSHAVNNKETTYQLQYSHLVHFVIFLDNHGSNKLLYKR